MTQQFHDAIKKGQNANVARVNIGWQQLDKILTDIDDGTYAVPNIDIDGGTQDGVIVGGTTPDEGTFTTLDATGDLTLGSVFKAATTNQQLVATTATDLVEFDDAILDTHSDFDVETHYFTPSVAGWYFLVNVIQYPALAGAKLFTTSFTKNGVAVSTKHLVSESATYNNALPHIAVQQANGVTDYFGVEFYNGDTGSVGIQGLSLFMGFRMF